MRRGDSGDDGIDDIVIDVVGLDQHAVLHRHHQLVAQLRGELAQADEGCDDTVEGAEFMLGALRPLDRLRRLCTMPGQLSHRYKSARAQVCATAATAAVTGDI